MSLNEPSSFSVVLHSFAFHRIISPLYRKYVETFGLEGDEVVLDFGCGPGALGRHIAGKLIQGNGRLVCLDQSHAWIEEARRRLKKFPNIEFIVGDASGLSNKEGFFDVISVHFMLHDVEAGMRRETVGALSRSLKDTGRLFIREPTKEKHGMPVNEIRLLMHESGLREQQYEKSKSLLMGAYYSGVFAKASGTY